MKLNDLRQNSEEFTVETRVSNAQANEWLISYSDLVTVLLCFFIMFFVIKARQQEKDYLQSIAASSKKELILSDVSKGFKGSPLDGKANIKHYDRYLSIQTRNQLFDETNALTLDGRWFLTELASMVFPYMPMVQLQVAVGAASKAHDMSRAIEVRRYLVGLGLAPELITVGAYQRGPASLDESDLDEVRVTISRSVYEN